MKIKKHKSQPGFTLLELMISIAIIGLLAAVASVAYQNYIKKSMKSEGYTQIRKIYDGALVFAQNEDIVVNSVQDSSLTHVSCKKRDPFGWFYTINTDSDRHAIAGRRKGSSAIAANIDSDPQERLGSLNPDGTCTTAVYPVSAYSIFGFSVQGARDPMTWAYPLTGQYYFSYASLPSQPLANTLIAEGKNVVYENDNNIMLVNGIYAVADLDGDFSPDNHGSPNGELPPFFDGDPEGPAYFASEGIFYSTLTYLMRGIYKNLDNGEIEGTPNIFVINPNE